MFLTAQKCALMLLLCAVPATAQVLSEKEILTRFSEQSPQAREAQARSQALRAELLGRTLYPNPSFSYSREGAGFNEFYETQQTLSINGRLRHLRKATGAAVEASEAESRFALWNFRSEVRRTFYSVLLAQEREAVLARSFQELQEVARILGIREKEGEGSKFDRLRAEREAAELRAEQGLLSAQAAQARAALLAFLPKDTKLARVTGTFALPGLARRDSLIERALAARGDIRAEERLVERFRLERGAAERLRYPDPTVSAGLKRAGIAGDIRTGLVVSFSVPLPFFNRGTTEITRLAAEEERARAKRQILERQVSAEVQGAYEVLLLRQQALAGYQEEMASSSGELARIAHIAYQEGELGILELLDAYRVNRSSQLRLLELQNAVKQAQIELDRLSGEEVQP